VLPIWTSGETTLEAVAFVRANFTLRSSRESYPAT
jgi:hypothetical protein